MLNNPTKPFQVSPARRRFFGVAGAVFASAIFGSLLPACIRREPLLRIGANTWPGYGLAFLARDRGYFKDAPIRLVELPSATAVIRNLTDGTLEGGMLTLDEVLTLRANQVDLVVVAVLDVSEGADVLLARPEVRSLSGLRGKRIGIEQGALGAVMLNAVLGSARLAAGDVKIVPVTHNQHYDAYMSKQVDAVITFEPVKSRLLHAGARQLFSSADIPGSIFDVLAVRREVVASNPQSLRQLIAGHFRALGEWQAAPAQIAPMLAPRLGVKPEQVESAFAGINLPDIAANRRWLEGAPAQLELKAAMLRDTMVAASLLPAGISISGLTDARFLPGA